jgi:electron transfer flavoprotein beta subunit
MQKDHVTDGEGEWPGHLRILVCVKQVPEPDGILIDREIDGADRIELPDEYRMNRFDEFAVEEAVRIKEAAVGCHVDVITVGPQRSADVLKRAMGMGADGGIHLQSPPEDDPSPAAVATWIAAYTSTRPYDMILCGTMSEDGMNGQVGPMLATGLDWPYATQVIEMQPSLATQSLMIQKEIESGVREILEVPLPALVAVQPGINLPRYPSLSNLLRANRQALEIIATETLAPAPVSADCLGIIPPVSARDARMIDGTATEKAEQLVALLNARALI